MTSLIEYRKKPVNLFLEDEHLFANEYEYKYFPPLLKNYKNIYYNTEGYVYQNFSIVKEPYRINSTVVNNSRFKNIFKCLVLMEGEINEKVLTIHDNWTYGYFEWHTDALSNLYFIQKYLSPDVYKLILPSYYLDYKYILDSLEIFGYNSRNIIFLPNSQIYKCKDISYCNLYTISGNYNSELIRGAVDKIKTKFPTTRETNDLLYISRSKTLKRKIVNETEVENILISFGFKIIHPEDLSYHNQVELFSSAKWLISIHGAGLTNMLFMEEGKNVLELREEHDRGNNCYFSLASTMNLNYFYLKCKRINKSYDHVGDLFVDTDKLKEILSKYLIQ